MKKLLVSFLVVGLASAANGIVLQISVNGDPDPVDSEIFTFPSEELILDIWSPSGHSGSPADDVYWILVVDARYGSMSGGAKRSLWGYRGHAGWDMPSRYLR
ncbi:MAG: hypothetical protein ACYST6_13355 [Planctomycetota bacterium]|jgi:hypothetical protein